MTVLVLLVAALTAGPATADELRLAPVADWLAHERLGEEFGAIGFYLSGHPLDNYQTALARLQASTYAQCLEDRRQAFQPFLAGTIIRMMERRGKNDQPYAFVSFSDPTGGIAKPPYPGMEKFPLEVMNHMTFEARGNQTELVFKGGPHNASSDERKFYESWLPSMNQGFSGTFAQLETYLETLKG